MLVVITTHYPMGNERRGTMLRKPWHLPITAFPKDAQEAARRSMAAMAKWFGYEPLPIISVQQHDAGDEWDVLGQDWRVIWRAPTAQARHEELLRDLAQGDGRAYVQGQLREQSHKREVRP